MIRPISTILLFCFLGASSAYADPGSGEPEKDGWKLKKETEYIKVYYRESENSRVNELKLTTTVRSSLSALVSMLRDVPNYPNWIYKCTVATPLGSASAAQGRYYTELDFPWPLQNRDMIAFSSLRQDPKTKVVTIQVEGKPRFMEEKRGIVRIETLSLEWVLTPLPGGKVRIDYQLLSDPGGMLPAWLINLALDQGPTQTIRGLREQVKRKKYQRAKLSYISE